MYWWRDGGMEGWVGEVGEWVDGWMGVSRWGWMDGGEWVGG